MTIQKYSVNQYPVQHILTWVQSGEIAIPEIQRPFVWDSTKVRDLLDSLYQGYPVGYLIVWQNPSVRLKDGSISKGKRILIDGQQRVTALMTSILGNEIIDKNYRSIKIKIAFNPIERVFEVSNSAIQKDPRWIADISKIFDKDFKLHRFVQNYTTNNNMNDFDTIYESIESLKGIVNNPIGFIELSSDLDIDTVTEIFIRINSSGVVLSQADFAMSKIAVSEKYQGNQLRKAIDYFCHLATKPESYNQLFQNDKDFTNTEYFKKMIWLKDDKEDIYDPSYTDMLRVAFTSKFKRGKLQDLVALLSGRDFEKRQYFEEIAEQSFNLLREGVLDFMNENFFKKFIMIIRSAGFIDSSMIRSQNALDFAYILYLILREKNMNQASIEQLVRKWFVLSVLKSRYSSSPESQFDIDIRRINDNPVEYINNVIEAELSDAYWNIGLPQQMDTSVASSPVFNVFLAAQVKMNDKGFLSKDITVKDLIELKGDVHHIFPKNYLKKQGYDRGMYNQVANYVIAQSEINIAIGDKEPSVYFQEVIEQCKTKKLKYGAITETEQLYENLRMNCIPLEILNENYIDYEEFLRERRKLMSEKIKKYFYNL
jgi:hypothetical protein